MYNKLKLCCLADLGGICYSFISSEAGGGHHSLFPTPFRVSDLPGDLSPTERAFDITRIPMCSCFSDKRPTQAPECPGAQCHGGRIAAPSSGSLRGGQTGRGSHPLGSCPGHPPGPWGPGGGSWCDPLSLGPICGFLSFCRIRPCSRPAGVLLGPLSLVADVAPVKMGLTPLPCITLPSQVTRPGHPVRGSHRMPTRVPASTHSRG